MPPLREDPSAAEGRGTRAPGRRCREPRARPPDARAGIPARRLQSVPAGVLTMDSPAVNLRELPSVDEVMRSPAAAEAVRRFGRSAATRAVRAVLVEARAARTLVQADDIVTDAFSRLDAQAQASLRPVFNLTGTVLHTNLGRALIAEEAVE